ncbi:MAG: lytic murein transglycosylase, partial [Geopsychrobacter sp.]|nr:lytic murein transglycosylase [Geopsychrobacter sp.]
MNKSLTGIATLLIILSLGVAEAAAPPPDFSHWRQQLRKEALNDGISARTFDQALGNLKSPLLRVLELDRNQPEFKQSLQDYVAKRVNNHRVVEGKKRLKRYPTWLARIEKRYAVQPRFILALWGIETGYGKQTGGFPVIDALATLAHDGRRAAYFRGELLDALHILDAGHIRLARMTGSWAGAMGQCQFMPSTFRHYAIDADVDGRIDIWGSVPDVLASAAHYLAKSGWQPGQGWGEKVKLKKGFDKSRAGLATRLPLSRWQSLGVLRQADAAKTVNTGDPEASLILP